MRFEYDVLVGSIPTETASRTRRRFPFLLWTHNTGRPEFLTVRTKLSAGITPSDVPSFRKPVPRHGKLVINLQVIGWRDVGIAPDIQVFMQDQKLTP